MSRTDYLSMAAAAAALLLLALLNFSSSGVVRGGGEDEGSGIGGTGRMAAPGGESGFGGTGFKPFLGLNEADEVEILLDPGQIEKAVLESIEIQLQPLAPVPSVPVASLARVIAESDLTRDSSAIDIAEQIQRGIEDNALLLQELQLPTPQPGPAGAAAEQFAALTSAPMATELPALADAAEVTSAPAAGADNASESALSWAELANYLASEQNAAAMEPRQLAAADSVTEPRSRMQRPERIQRPELPPVQRIQPIRPTAILPPRVKPMRL